MDRPVVPLHFEVAPARAGSVIASWPAEANGSEFQRAPDLSGEAWTRVFGGRERVGERLQSVVPAGDAPGFYRLAR